MGHKIASIALGLLITFSANTQSLAQKDYPYNISGNLTNRVNTKIYLAVHANIPNSKKTIIDSVQVKDGNFNLEGSAPIGMYALFVRKNDQWKQIFLDGNEIKITGNNDSLYNSKVTGSKELDVLNTLDEEIRPIKIVEEGLLAKMLEYQKNKQTDSIKLAMPKFKALQSQIYKKIENFLSIHPNSYAALVCYDRYGKKISTGPAIIDSLEKMPDKYKTLDLYKSIVSKYKATETFAIGKQIKHFTLLDDMGEPFNTNSLKGKYILIDFWASWCVPCRKENPNLRLNYKKYNSKGFEILSVSIDTDTAAWRAAIKADQLKWKQVIGRQSDPQIEKYAITQIPTSYLINPDGKIIGVNVRGKELDSELEKIFKEL